MARSRPQEDSLELLLDTICNTFGGIVFLSLLVCLMAQRVTPGSTAAEADAALAKLHERKVIEADLEHVSQAVAALEELRLRQLAIAQSLGEPGDATGHAGTAQRLTGLRAIRRALDGEEEELRRSLARARELSRVAEAQAGEARGTASRAAQEVERAGRELDEARRQRSTTLRLPRARRTTKRQVAAFISGGRLRLPFVYSAAGLPDRRNEQEIEAGAPEEFLTPRHFRPDRGTIVTDSEDSRRALAARFDGFDREASYVNLAVWPDSYAEFKLVRDHLVARGFDYQVLLIESGGAVTFGSVVSHEVQ